jgi:hypothetical protein
MLSRYNSDTQVGELLGEKSCQNAILFLKTSYRNWGMVLNEHYTFLQC